MAPSEVNTTLVDVNDLGRKTSCMATKRNIFAEWKKQWAFLYPVPVAPPKGPEIDLDRG